MNKLDQEEKKTIEAFETGKLKPVNNWRREMARHRKAAAATFARDSRLNIRISSKDLRAVQEAGLG
jgi:predicted DNA binding CopG/RHH family protein